MENEPFEPFLEAASTKSIWVFNSNDVRKKVFEAAHVKLTGASEFKIGKT